MSPSDVAVLSSASSILDDLILRITDVADRYQGTDREGIAFQLHEVERALRSASRLLESTQRSLR
jgi:hypothetical protein